MQGSSLRALARLLLYAAATLPLMPLQAVFVLLGSRLARRLPVAYHAACCRLLGLARRIEGEISSDRPTLFVANHTSYLDITILSASVETSFIAKREVARWPFFGWLARLQRTVFVDRRVSRVASERDDVARRLAQGDNLVLFAEGTSSDGVFIRSFKSSLFAVAEREFAGRKLVVQPVTLAYTRLDGMPIGRAWRPLFAWYGDMDMVPHMFRLLGLGRIDAELIFHPPVTLAEFASRKSLAEHCERTIRSGLAAVNAGRTAPLRPAAAVQGALALAGGAS
ncbi:MAG TPA: lysophospholipid acyltransferase family protein [Alphaproteobacteria bacterium]|nr:lysophospholipid acyltransferase family protein [Alphaproteobacteria bacterium]